MPKSRTATTPQLKLGVDFQPNLETDMAASSYPTFSQQIPSVWSSPYPPQSMESLFCLAKGESQDTKAWLGQLRRNCVLPQPSHITPGPAF